MNLSRCLLICLWLSLLGTQTLASITYDIAPREGKLESWSLDGGSITTDGTLGVIDSSNFLSWKIHFTSPAGETIISSSTGGQTLEHSFRYAGNDSAANPSNEPSNYTFTPPPPSYTTLVASRERLTFQIGNDDIYYLFFSTGNLLDEDFIGDSFVFFPRGKAIRLLGSGGGSIVGPGILFDNAVDSSTPLHPLQDHYFGIEHPNTSGIVDSFDLYTESDDELVVGIASQIPEPCSLFYAILGVIACTSRRRR